MGLGTLEPQPRVWGLGSQGAKPVLHRHQDRPQMPHFFTGTPPGAPWLLERSKEQLLFPKRREMQPSFSPALCPGASEEMELVPGWREHACSPKPGVKLERGCGERPPPHMSSVPCHDEVSTNTGWFCPWQS